MKYNLGKIMLSDRYTLILSTAVMLIVTLTFITYISIHNLKKENKRLMDQHKEMHVLKQSLVQIKDMVESKEKKIGLTKSSGAVFTLEHILKALQLKAKVIKPLDKKRVKEFTEENAEVKIEGIDLNAVVNLFYKVEHSPVPIKIKSAHINTTFEDPDKFLLAFTASLISK
jgi:hypothetical protein